jgi:6,7-dimethyl-8-ribityllumazine synthase
MNRPWRLGIATARFNSLITERLQQAALALLHKHGCKDPVLREVPGSFELPLAAQWLITEAGVDGVICLGAVIRGESQHFDYVCQAATSGLLQVQLTTGRPVGFGVLTCDSLEQALDRAGGKHGNKGAETAATVLEMLELKGSFSTAPFGAVSGAPVLKNV